MKELRRRQWLTLGSIALAVASLGIALTTFMLPTTDEVALRSQHLLPTFVPSEVYALAFTRDGVTFRLERQLSKEPAEWELLSPEKGEADVALLDKILRGLESANFVRRLSTDSLNQPALGLKPPRFSLTFSTRQQSCTLTQGNPVPGQNSQSYVEISCAGDRMANVYVVESKVTDDWKFDLNALRRVQFLPYGSVEVSAVEQHVRGVTKRLERDERGLWYVRTEKRHLVERQAVDRLFETLADMDGALPTDWNKASLEQAKDPNTLSLTLFPLDTKNPRATLRFGTPCPSDPNLVLALRIEPHPVALCVQPSFVTRLQLADKDLTSRRLFWLRSDEVEKLRIVSDARRLVLERSNSAFLLKEPQRIEVPLEPGNTRLEALTSLSGQPVEEELTPPFTLIELESQALSDPASFTESVRVGAPNAQGKCVVERTSDGARFLLSSEQAQVLRPDATLMKPLNVLDIPRSRISEVRISGPNFEQTLGQSAPGAYALRTAARAVPHDAALIDSIIGTLSALRAERWVSDEVQMSHGLSDGRAFHLKLHLSAPAAASSEPVLPQNITLTLGARTRQGYFASVDTLAGVFIVTSATFDTLTTWALDRSLCQIAPGTAEAITLRKDRQTVTLRAQGEGWAAVDNEGREITQGLEDALEALASLRAEAALHVGAALPEEGLTQPWLSVAVTPKDAREGARMCEFGAGDSWRNTSIYYLRRSGTPATFAIARSELQALLELF
ncbi:MAG: DUF4340 domain-containing protein [Polyangiaceae bacterium]|nr:DUF4340 domain-containing protein [Polyangiaceae bacterium]